MNLGIYDVVIDFSKLFVHNTTSISFKEGDLNTAKIKARLNMQGKVIDITGCSVAVKIETINGVKITDTATIIDPVNGIVEIDFKSNSIVKGTNFFELWIIKDDSVKKSPRLGYRVLDSIDDAGAIEGTNEYPILISLISDTNKAIKDAKEVLNIAKDMEANVNEAIGNTNIAISNAEAATSNANSKIAELDEAKTGMIEKVDSSIVTMKSEVETAKNEMTSKADEKIADVDRALAAGTVDLELKEARKDASGVVHDTVKQRLDSDLIVGDKSLKDFVIDMNGMKESQDLAYETNNSYQVCTDTQSGVVKDLKVYGETMINKCSNDFTKTNTGIYYSTYGENDVVGGKEYTFKVYNNTGFDGLEWGVYGILPGQPNSLPVIPYTKDFSQKTFTLPSGYAYFRLYIRYHKGDYIDFDVSKIKAVTVEGEKVIVNYFKGMASVGNGTPLDVSTLKWDGNLFDDRVLNPFITSQSDSEYTLDYGKIWYERAKLVNLPFKENTSYKFMCTQKCSNATSKPRFYLHYTDGTEDQVTVGNVEWETVTSISRPNKTLEYISVTYGNSGGIWTVKKDSICLYEDTTKDKFEPYFEDKKPILYKDANGAWKPVTELNGIDKNNCDIVDTVKNRYVKKFIKYKVTGDETMGYITDYGTVSRFYIMNMFPKNNKLNAPPMCNILPLVAIGTSDVEGINSHSVSMNYISFQIKSSRLESKDVIGFKKWLKANNVEIVIELEVPQEYELNPIYPDSYEGDTMVMIRGGALPIKASWKITSSLPNFVKELSDQIKQLQDQVYKTNVANFTVALNTLDTKLRLDRLEAPQM